MASGPYSPLRSPLRVYSNAPMVRRKGSAKKAPSFSAGRVIYVDGEFLDSLHAPAAWRAIRLCSRRYCLADQPVRAVAVFDAGGDPSRCCRAQHETDSIDLRAGHCLFSQDCSARRSGAAGLPPLTTRHRGSGGRNDCHDHLCRRGDNGGGVSADLLHACQPCDRHSDNIGHRNLWSLRSCRHLPRCFCAQSRGRR